MKVFEPLNMSFSTRFSGILKTDDKIEIIYPSDLTLSSKYDKSSTVPVKASCKAIIADITYQPNCMITPSSRKFIFNQISAIKLDFTAYNNGVLTQLIINDVFVNPESS